MIDKNKAYRFRGDSERWEWNDFSSALANGTLLCNPFLANHLQERGILLEYPELPSEDWEFCEAKDCERVWCDEQGRWDGSPREYWCSECGPIYCRKKKPVYENGTVQCVVETYWSVGDRIDRIDLPSGFAGPGDRVKVTKL